MDFARSVTLRQVGGKIVGIAMLGVRETKAGAADLGLSPEFRGRRLAPLLLSVWLEKARSARIKILGWKCLKETSPR